MSLAEFITNNLPADTSELVLAITIGILFILMYDFYHLLFSAVLSWFKKS